MGKTTGRENTPFHYFYACHLQKKIIEACKDARRCDVVFTLGRIQKTLTHIHVLLRYAKTE